MWNIKVSWDLVDLEREVRKHEEREEAARDGIFFTQRAIYRSLLVYNSVFYELDDVITDLDKAIEIGDIRSLPYRLRGLFLLMKLTECLTASDEERKQILARVQADYQVALEREPTDGYTRLCLIEASLLSHDWDEAISKYGESRPYVQTPTDIIVWSLLGCLALALGGETIEEEDARPLIEAGEKGRLEPDFKEGELGPLLVRLRTLLLDGLRSKPGYEERWRTANEIVRGLIKKLGVWPLHDSGPISYSKYEKVIVLREVDNLGLVELSTQRGDKFITRSASGGNIKIVDKAEALTNALAQNDNTIKAKPNDVAAWYERAIILDRLERHGDALGALERVIELEPGLSILGGSARFAKGNLLAKQNRYREALEALDDVIRLYGADIMLQAVAWLKKAVIIQKLAKETEPEVRTSGDCAICGDGSDEARRLREEALLAWERAIAVRPNFVEAWVGKADILSLLGRHEEGLEAYNMAILVRPYYAIVAGVESWESLMKRGDLFEKLGRYEEALEAFDKGLEFCFYGGGRNKGAEALIWLHKAEVYTKLKRYEEAIEAYDEAISCWNGRFPFAGSVWRKKAALLERLERHEEAQHAFKMAKELDLKNAAE